MRQIDVEERDWVRLQGYAKPFEDTPASVVSRVLDFYERNHEERSRDAWNEAWVADYGPHSLPPLRHAKVLSADVQGQTPDKRTWDAILRHVLLRVCADVGSVERLRTISGANVEEGLKTDDGYKHIAEENFSYQGVSADDAVKIINRSASYLNVPVRVEVEWRHKDGAYRPGERARIMLGSGGK